MKSRKSRVDFSELDIWRDYHLCVHAKDRQEGRQRQWNGPSVLTKKMTLPAMGVIDTATSECIVFRVYGAGFMFTYLKK